MGFGSVNVPAGGGDEEKLKAHLEDKNNPHKVTAEKVGLGNVPNVATNDQTPTFSVAGTLAALTSGEKLSVSMGKIAKAISDLISHLADTTKHITAAERTKWNGKADGNHNHGGQSINPSSVELSPGTSAGHGGYIDFHYNSSAADYTSRIIESASGTLSIEAKNGVAVSTAAQNHTGAVLRNEALYSSDTTPTTNGQINWTYG